MILLWFAWKFVPLWYQQQPQAQQVYCRWRCDLLENSYLCGINNNFEAISGLPVLLWFAWKFVPLWYQQQRCTSNLQVKICCDLLENSYLCGINNNAFFVRCSIWCVVICLKIRTFVVSTTTKSNKSQKWHPLWFAWKFVPLWYQQQPAFAIP